MTTIVLITVAIVTIAISLALWVVLLRAGLRWVKAPKITARGITSATVMIFVAQLAVIYLTIILENVPVPGPSIVVSLIGSILVPVLIIAVIFRLSLPTAFKAWLPTLLGPLVSVVLVMVVLKPFILEAFQSPANAMAPTLLGNHWRGVCKTCGGQAFSRVEQYPNDILMICRDHFHITQATSPSEQIHSPDRFLVAKYLKPQRWDVVVFRFPAQPSTLYVMRLIGLPGEEITIRDGKVCANGAVLEPPDSLRGIQYEIEDGTFMVGPFATESDPATLADDEYFVLGDFTSRSNDSRYWYGGAPGHPPYAVPGSHIVGVVTHIYWPMDRWRCLR